MKKRKRTARSPQKRCMACLGGPWVTCSVLHAWDDGTFDVAPVGQEDNDLERWRSLTAPEISLDDEAVWPATFDLLRGDAPGIGWRQAGRALARLGMTIEDEPFKEYWTTNCSKMFHVTAKAAEAMHLDQAQSYRLFTWAGYSARLLADPASDPSKDLFKLYWNSIRMGGREPAEIGRTVTLDDCLEALGLAKAPEDTEASAAIARFEKKASVVVPATLKAMWSRAGAMRALRDAHPNNPEPLAADKWTLARDDSAWDAPCAVKIMDPHQGDHGWWAVFKSEGEDACVWVSFEDGGAPVRRVARSLPFFFWDMCQTRRTWDISTRGDG
jgi:hypothetical protein